MCSLLICKGRNRSRELFGREPQKLTIPYNKAQLENLYQFNEDWILALQNYTGQILYHYPRHPIIEFARHVELIFPVWFSHSPLDHAVNIFTDGSSTGRAAVFTQTHGLWVEEGEKTSAQQAEIRAAILAFEKFSQELNLFTDSKYVANLFPALETALLSGKSPILPFLQKLQNLVHNRSQKFYVGHIRGHSKLPGPLAQGNAMADLLTQNSLGAFTIQEAQQSHAMHYQNASALRKMFSITREKQDK